MFGRKGAELVQEVAYTEPENLAMYNVRGLAGDDVMVQWSHPTQLNTQPAYCPR